MSCTRPRTVGFLSDGKTITWSQKKFDRQYPPFQLPCGKCIECRLEYARQWAVRCVHESQMHSKNAFITLTYSDEKLESPWLNYRHFQLFLKKLRKSQNEPITYFVTGEYGERTKRPHWHAIIFNWWPRDADYFRSNARGDRIYRSASLDGIWGRGNCEVGSVTMESAGYCARYAAKKLVHGEDEDHDYQPISKKSTRPAIGSRWLERYWSDVFATGGVRLKDGSKIAIPRYYERWLKKHHPEHWLHYLAEVKSGIIEAMDQKQLDEQRQRDEINSCRLDSGKSTFIKTENEVREIIQKQKFEQLQKNLKL